MADVPSSLQTIDTNEVSYKAAVSEATLTKIGGTVNALIKNGPESLGTLVTSILTEAQFQSIRGATWVRMSGQDITGSDLANLTGNTTLPDMVDLSTTVNDKTESSLGSHAAGSVSSHTHNIRVNDGGSASSKLLMTAENFFENETTFPTNAAGGSNNLPAGLRVNYFIKINL